MCFIRTEGEKIFSPSVSAFPRTPWLKENVSIRGMLLSHPFFPSWTRRFSPRSKKRAPLCTVRVYTEGSGYGETHLFT